MSVATVLNVPFSNVSVMLMEDVPTETPSTGRRLRQDDDPQVLRLLLPHSSAGPSALRSTATTTQTHASTRLALGSDLHLCFRARAADGGNRGLICFPTERGILAEWHCGSFGGGGCRQP